MTASERARTDEHSVVSFPDAGLTRLRLFCFPYAGGSSAAYKDWCQSLPGIHVCAVELPGRGRRFSEVPLRNLRAAVDEAASAIERRIDMPYALYGHSMGAVTALETALELARRGKRARCLVVSGSPAPHLPLRRPRLLHSLPGPEFLAALQELETLPELLLRKPDVLEAFLPTIRADMESRETWSSQIQDTGIPIAAFGGREDRHVSLDELRAWACYTTAGFTVTQLEGGHFFIRSNAGAFLPMLQEALTRCLSL